MIRESVTLACGATLSLELRDNIMQGVLDDLVVESEEQAQTIWSRPGARGACILDYSQRLVVSGLEITNAEAQQMIRGADPIDVLLPPGLLRVVPDDMKELLLEADVKEIFE